MSHYKHKSMADAKFESSSLSAFGDMTSQTFPLKKGTSHRIRYLLLENGFNLEKISFYVQNRSFRPEIGPHDNFSNFQAEENCFIFTIFDMFQ